MDFRASSERFQESTAAPHRFRVSAAGGTQQPLFPDAVLDFAAAAVFLPVERLQAKNLSRERVTKNRRSDPFVRCSAVPNAGVRDDGAQPSKFSPHERNPTGKTHRP